MRGAFVEFFGRPARTPVGPAYLARRTGASLLPLFLAREGWNSGHYVLRCHPPIVPDAQLDEEQDIHRMLQALTRHLEEQIRLLPGQWNWMYPRWRHDPRRHLRDWEMDHLDRH